MNKINYTIEQSNTIKKIIEFSKQDDDHLFYLFGAAGTGKTMIITNTIFKLYDDKLIQNLMVCAPTHQALNVIYNYFLNHEKYKSHKDNIVFHTIHQFLELKVIIDQENGNIKFQKINETNNETDNNKNLIIIDECSMISQEIAKNIKEYSKNNKLKIIFIGDSNQLPPVNEKISSLFNDIEKNYQFVMNLKKIMRTNENIIKNASKIIRNSNITDNIHNKLTELYKLNNKNKHFKFYHNNNLNKDSNLIKKIINLIEINEIPIVLAWRNATVKKYNNAVRNIIHKKQEDSYLVGDHIIMNNFYNVDELNLFTGDILMIKKISDIKYIFYDFKDINNLSGTPHGNIFLENISKINMNNINFCSIEAQRLKDNKIHKIKTIHNNFIADYVGYKEKIRNEIILLIKKIKNKKMISTIWEKYHKKIVSEIADINYSYSLTVHKSQGSTFKTIFVDMTDILYNSNKLEAKKCLYTAIGRCSKNLNIII